MRIRLDSGFDIKFIRQFGINLNINFNNSFMKTTIYMKSRILKMMSKDLNARCRFNL